MELHLGNTLLFYLANSGFTCSAKYVHINVCTKALDRPLTQFSNINQGIYSTNKIQSNANQPLPDSNHLPS